MCDCCEKIIKKIPVTGPQGPQGEPGTNPTRYFEDYAEISLSDEGDDFVLTILESGNYILQYEAYITRTEATTVNSRLTKNGVFQVANINYIHTTTELESIAETTFTHTAKLESLISGDIIGFNLDASVFCLVTNASLTILKLT